MKISLKIDFDLNTRNENENHLCPRIQIFNYQSHYARNYGVDQGFPVEDKVRVPPLEDHCQTLKQVFDAQIGAFPRHSADRWPSLFNPASDSASQPPNISTTRQLSKCLESFSSLRAVNVAPASLCEDPR
jgi:hypothetical protein